jgi:hypothetical protein
MRTFPLVLLLALPAAAVIVDRAAITVGDRVITDSEVDLRIRLTAFQNGEKPEVNPSSRKRAAELLIDQKLIEREMDVGHYPRLSEDGRKELLAGFAKAQFQSNPKALDQALTGYGLTGADLEDDLARQSDLLTFLSLRFRPAVQVSDQQVQEYYRNVLTKGQTTLNDLRGQIEDKLTGERADTDMESWLLEQRKRTKIQYLEKDLAP